MKRGTGVCQHLVVCLVCRLRGDGIEGKRRRGTYRVFRSLGVSIVYLAVVYLVIDAIRPVILGHICMNRINIPPHIEISPHMPHLVPFIGFVRAMMRVFRCPDAYSRDASLDERAAFQCGRPRLVVVVDDVHIHALTAVASVASPVVENVVSQIHPFVSLCTRSGAEARHTAFMVGKQIMVISSSASSPVAPVTVGPFRVACIFKTLSHKAPLHRNILAAINRQAFIDAPAHRTVVDHHIV